MSRVIHDNVLRGARRAVSQSTRAFARRGAEAGGRRGIRGAAGRRARGLWVYMCARDDGLRGLDVAHEGLARGLRADRVAALEAASKEDVPLLYWTAAAWGAAIAAKKDDPDLLADLPIVEGLIRRALALQPDFDDGALHELLIAYEGSRSEAMGGSIERARRHFEEAVRVSGGQRVQPYLTLAETVAVRQQDRKEFESLLKRALEIDPDARPEWRLANLVGHRRGGRVLARPAPRVAPGERRGGRCARPGGQ